MKDIFAVKDGEIRINLSEVDYTIDENQLLGIQEKVEFVPVREYSFNSNKYLTYEVQNFISLKEHLQILSSENEDVQFEKYTAIVKQLVKILLIGTKYLFVSQNNIILDLDAIFIDKNTTKLKFIYAPFMNAYYSNVTKKRLASLIASIEPYIKGCGHAVTLQSNITQYLNNDEGDFRHLYKQIIIWENKLLGREPELEANQERNSVSNKGVTGKKVLSKKLKKEFILTAVIFQIILVVLIFLFNKMGVFAGATEGSFSIAKFIGGIFVVGLLVEYCLYKFSIEKKNIFDEEYVVAKDGAGVVDGINNKIGKLKAKAVAKKEKSLNKSAAKKQLLNEDKTKDSDKTERNQLADVSTEEVAVESAVLVSDAKTLEADVNLSDEPVEKEETLAYILLNKDFEQEKYDITKDHIKIGRRDDNDIIILKKHVSRVHAYIEKKEDKYFIVDSGSFNKTYLNDIVLGADQKYELKDGDQIRFADISAEFKIAV